MPLENGKDVRFGVCNGGKVNVYIPKALVRLLYPLGGVRISEDLRPAVLNEKRVLCPGEIAEFHLNLTDTLSDRVKEKPRALEVVVLLYCSFPDGETYTKIIPIGTLSVTKSIVSLEINVVNEDFLKGANQLRLYERKG
jgi:hypothetical protein